jgi:CubicO group peptidase (beta-lactamase class C family)
MMLVERHSLSYEDTLSHFFPRFPQWAGKITIRNLLNHTGGVPDYFSLGLDHPGTTNRAIAESLATIPVPRFEPGSRFEYTNSGYVILALIVEKVSGLPFHLFLRKNIFEPLGMTRTLVYDESRPEINGRAKGYNRFLGEDDYTILTEGDGGIFSTAGDLFLWDRALYSDRLVRQSTLGEAFTPVTLRDGTVSTYGFGWAILDRPDGKIVLHAGGLGGFRTLIERYLAPQNTIILLTNTGNRKLGEIRDALAAILAGSPYRLPRKSVAEAMQRIVAVRGLGPAVQFTDSLAQVHDSTYDFSEPELNELGYFLAGLKQLNAARTVLEMNVRAYPASGNVYDSLVEIELQQGDEQAAIRDYRKSPELNPANLNAATVLKRLHAK